MSTQQIDFYSLSKDAMHSIWIDRDLYEFKKFCSLDFDIVGFSDTDNVYEGNLNGVNIFPFLQDTSLQFNILHENYRKSFSDEQNCVMICEHQIRITKKDYFYQKTFFTTLVFKQNQNKASIVHAHFSVSDSASDSYDKIIESENESHEKEIDENSLSEYYRKLILNNCDLFIDCDTSEYILHYDKEAYQKLFDDDTYFINPDRWFWHICNTCVHPDDTESLDIFRKIDMEKRIRNHITKIETTFRIKNRSQGYIWVQLQVISKISEDNHLEKIALMFRQLDKSQFNELEFLEKSRKDKLTGVYNKTYFEYLLNIYLKDYNPTTTPSVALIDIDHFRLINDTFGHLTGDVILCQFARSLMTFFGQDSIIGRIKGDKFAVLIKNMPSEFEVTKLVDNFLKNMRHTHFEMGTSLDIHCSAGIVLINDSNKESISTIISQTNDALSQAKDNGRNCYVVYR